MSERRRQVLKALGATAAVVAAGRIEILAQATATYGRIGSLIAVAGQRDALIAALVSGASRMPGCVSYVVGKDVGNPDVLWITELWDSQASHAASLKLPHVRETITRAKPLIAGFGQSVVIEPVANIA